MITGLRAQNFKSWKDTGEIKMGALTGFFGTNSSGKTAILQILLLLKQTVESPDRSHILNTGGDQYSYVDVGTVYDIIHNKQVPGEISFGLDWKPQQLVLTLPPVKKGKGRLTFFLNGAPAIRFNTSLQINEKKTLVDTLGYSFDAKEDNFGITLRQKVSDTESEVEYDALLETDAEPYIEQPFSVEPFKCYGFSILDNEYREESGFDKWLLELQLQFENLFKRIYYLGPLRDYPHRIYTWGGQKPQDVGRRGENAVEALLASDKEVQAAVAQNLKDLKVIKDFKLEPLAKGRREHELLIQVTERSPFVPVTDVGFGVSQVLPVLVLCHYVPEGSIIILEQPEIHLHPAVQAGLADVLIQVIKERKLQIILESHSEHLLRRLQRRIAEQTITNEDAKLYFCHIEGGESKLEELDLDEYGNINNWPENFFGDEMGDMVAMTKAQIARKREEKAAENAKEKVSQG